MCGVSLLSDVWLSLWLSDVCIHLNSYFYSSHFIFLVLNVGLMLLLQHVKYSELFLKATLPCL